MIIGTLSVKRTVSLVLLMCLVIPGCRATSSKDAPWRPAAQARWSFVKFNLLTPMGPQLALDTVCGDGSCGHDSVDCDSNETACDANCSAGNTLYLNKALLLMGKSTAELDQLMRCHGAPVLADIEGPWNGINKGVATALLGVTQDTKVFQAAACGCDQAGTGYNIQVQQVSLCDLAHCGFRPQIDRHTGRVSTMGNFVIRPVTRDRDPMILDYTAAENGRFDPSRRLVDELVMIEPNLLLGRAHVKIGSIQVPIAYFVLYRD